MPSTQQRLQVWQGLRAKTSGGLTKADLVKNKRGKIVSKKKSKQAHDQNNLKSFLREKGKSIPKDKMLYARGSKAPKPEASKGAARTAPKKQRERPAIAAKKPAAPPVRPERPKRKLAPKKKKKVSTLTKQAPDSDSKTAISVDNVRRGRRKRKKRQIYNAGSF